MINWKTNDKDFDLLVLLARRASSELHFDYRTTLMDVQACYGNGNSLDLASLVKAAPGDFAHDVAGIWQNIDRETGKLLNCFAPRYSEDIKKQTA